jgi:diaminohydroxyphosphoribosylaminopyrimidine deaminase/5-amino-6-(5-phosphoribosylamino)uracil reductase
MSEQQYMQLALDLAVRAVGRTCPNPPVGAVVVRDNEIVGRGYHPEAGQPHAEIFALNEAGEKAAGATLYVTLEPCNHQGRTGPCTEAIIKAGISRVVVGATDPNPKVAGTGLQRLKTAGIEIESGVLNDECRELIAPFARHVSTGLPLVTLKMAMTLDGQTATSSGDSRWISNEESRLHVHRMRDRSDAIMAGIGTVLADDPQLTTRLPDGGQDPIRIVVDSNLQLPVSAQVLTVDSPTGLVVITIESADIVRIKSLEKAGAEVVVVPAVDGQVDLKAMVAELGRRNIQSVLLEGGATLAAAALRQGIIDRVAIFVAPKLLGGNDGAMLFNGIGCTLMSEAVKLENIRVSRFGDDVLYEGEVA